MIRALMGSDDNGDQQVKISIQLDTSNAVSAGTALRGRVVLEVISKTAIEGGPVQLAITGREIVRVASSKRKTSVRRFCRTKKELRDFCDRRLGPGRVYAFPFSIKLPESLPSSCSYKHGKDLSFKVEYGIHASGFSASKIMEFEVASVPLPDERIPCLRKPVTQAVKSMNGAVEQGFMTLAAGIVDTHVGRGDNIRLSLAFRNNSACDIQRIQVKLVEAVSGDTRPPEDGDFGEDRTFKQDIYVKRSAKMMGPKSELESLCKGTTHSDDRLRGDTQLRDIYRELFNDDYTFDFRCPDTARDSYSGKLLHVRHYLKIKMMTNAVTDNPSVTIPLMIGHPPPRSRSQQAHAIRPPASSSSPSRGRRSPSSPTQEQSTHSSSSPTQQRPERTRPASGPLAALSSLEALPPPPPVSTPQSERRTGFSFSPTRQQLERTRITPEIPVTSSDFQALASMEALPFPSSIPVTAPQSEHRHELPASAPVQSRADRTMAQSDPNSLSTAGTFATDSTTLPSRSHQTASSPPVITRTSRATNITMSQSVPNLPPSAPVESFATASATVPDYTSQSTNYLPEATAIPISGLAINIDAQTTFVEASAVVLGGDATLLEEEDPDTFDYSTIAPRRPLPPAYAPSLPNLIEEMLASVEDYCIILAKIRDPGWQSLLAGITPDEFGAIIGHVNMDFNQPLIALRLAPILNGGSNFTCEYCAAAVRCTSEWNRATIVEKLVHLCVDLVVNKHLIQEELSEWDQIITDRCITECLASCA